MLRLGGGGGGGGKAKVASSLGRHAEDGLGP
jgi:hypothetical protein